ncbi:putative translation initiation factor eIF-2B subunit beta [Echria macrotheca]|uniref:Translation initiation factor eIF2B subunit beta n=1 Tax=Echria macrotheca TaxID=438768 RepID=A0AAJ0BEN2_9PEZI|nr:putative translation initiation factor eIF-2B subunit beta [Echria macrotheca]
MAPTHTSHAPSMEKLVKSLKGQPLEASIDAFIYLLKRRQVKGDDCAGATAHILRQVVAKSKWHDVEQLLFKVQSVGSRLVGAAPHEPVIGNIVRRVLGLIRDEASEERNAEDEFGSESASDIQTLAQVTGPPPAARPAPTPLARPPTLATAASFHASKSKSMFNLLSVVDAASAPLTAASTPLSQAAHTSINSLRPEVLDGIEEILDEINQADDQIAGFADIQIHPGDYVLAYLPSRTVERFLIKAASRRKFTVLFVSLEDSRSAAGEGAHAALRKKLDAHGVNTISLASNGLMAYMSRINKVVFSAKVVYQNGGLLVDSGASVAAQAAKAHSKPVIALGGVYKFCPEDPSDEIAGETGDSSTYVSYADGLKVDALEVENTVADYVPPELVDVYLTNLGPQTRHHLAAILADHYKAEDVGFSLIPGEV